jgi:malonyl-ACP O-methyltransferase BioC
MNKNIIEQRFTKSLKTYDQYAIVQQEMLNHLADLCLKHVGQSFSKTFEFGMGTGMLTQRLLDTFRIEHLYINDLNTQFYQFFRSNFNYTGKTQLSFLSGDVERISIPKQLDLVISSATEQWLRNKPEFYAKIAESLKSQAYFVFSTFGPENYAQLKDINHLKSLSYWSQNQTEAALNSHFEVLFSESTKVNMKFNSVLEMLQHMKYTGVNGLNSGMYSKKQLNLLIDQIAEVTKQNSHYELSYHPIFYMVRKR